MQSFSNYSALHFKVRASTYFTRFRNSVKWRNSKEILYYSKLIHKKSFVLKRITFCYLFSIYRPSQSDTTISRGLMSWRKVTFMSSMWWKETSRQSSHKDCFQASIPEVIKRVSCESTQGWELADVYCSDSSSNSCAIGKSLSLLSLLSSISSAWLIWKQ